MGHLSISDRGLTVQVCFMFHPLAIVSLTQCVEATTNLNNQAVGIDWLDDGAQDPLVAFLNGTTDNVELDGNKNE